MILTERNRVPSSALKPVAGRTSVDVTAAVWSGSVFHAIGTSRISGTSAKANIGCQPQFGMTRMPSSAAIEPPMGTPDIIIVATAARHFAGISSAASALEVGTRPPRPSPAIRRNAPNMTGPVASAHSAVNTDRTIAHPITARLRPTTSERRPASTAPIIIPRNARLPRVPAVAALMPHSFCRLGMTLP